MLRGPGEREHTEWDMLNLGPWGLVCGSGGWEQGWVGPTASLLVGQFSLSLGGGYRQTRNHDLKELGSLPCGLQSKGTGRQWGWLCLLPPAGLVHAAEKHPLLYWATALTPLPHFLLLLLYWGCSQRAKVAGRNYVCLGLPAS